MMGPTALNEIKSELRQHLGKVHKDLANWLDRQIEKLYPESLHDPTVAEDLLWVRKMLRAAERKTGGGKATRLKGGTKPVA